MKNPQKLGLALLIVATIVSIKVFLFPNTALIPSDKTTKTEDSEQKPEEINRKIFVNVFFIAQNEKNEEVYRAVKRLYNQETDGTKLNFAVKKLIEGPNAKEKSKGAYSEIPSTTRIISIEEKPEQISINLSGDFEGGGGTDSIYKRVYQLIKTVNKNTDLPVYLYINGKEAEVLGGEGIMINQPLNERSLEE